MLLYDFVIYCDGYMRGRKRFVFKSVIVYWLEMKLGFMLFCVYRIIGILLSYSIIDFILVFIIIVFFFLLGVC